ncbi:MAG: NTP transferase domain-containing protein, partial [bacterium]|nr:NTP transferase domain-containing protein [bacterium]
MDKSVSVLILAAGLGTRMKSRKAKVLHRAGGRPLVEHVVRSSLEVTQADRITVVVGHQAEEVQAAVEPHGVQFATQAEQRGSGDAVMWARENLAGGGELLLVMCGGCALLSADALRE